MGFRELIDALRKEGDEKIRAIWQEAEAEAEKIRADTEKRIREITQHHNRMLSRAIKEQSDAILSEARTKTRTIMLQSENELSLRLYRIATGMLNILRNGRYKDVFGRLVQELPACRWGTVRVNPGDVEMAREYFPDSEIIPDSSITGGLEAIAEGGRIRVVNTFEKRLERCWPEMLPELIHDVRCMMD